MYDCGADCQRHLVGAESGAERVGAYESLEVLVSEDNPVGTQGQFWKEDTAVDDGDILALCTLVASFSGPHAHRRSHSVHS